MRRRSRRTWVQRLARATGVTTWGLATFGHLPVAHAQSTWLSWTERDECPTAADIERRVSQLLRDPLPADQLQVRAHAEPRDDGWTVAVNLTFSGRVGQRRVTVSSCDQAADFVAVAVVLAIAPDSGDEPSGDTAAARDTASPKDTAPSNQPEQTPSQASGAGTPPPPESASRLTLRPFADLEGEASVQPLPGVAWGGNLELGATIEPAWFGAGVRWLPQRTVNPDRAVAPLEFSLLSGRVAGGYLWRWSALNAGLHAVVEGGALFVRARGVGSEPTTDNRVDRQLVVEHRALDA